MNLSSFFKSLTLIMGIFLLNIQESSAIMCDDGGEVACRNYCQQSDRNCADGTCDKDNYCHCWNCQGDYF